MKNNKKILLLVMTLILLVAMPLVATSIYDSSTDLYKQTAEPFEGTSVRSMGMGGAGIGITGYYDSFLLNPANLGAGNLKISLPAVTLTVFNPNAILKSGAIDDLQSGDENATISAAQKFLGTIGTDYGDVMTTDLSMVLGLGSFGFGLQAQERLMSYKTGADTTSTNLIAQVTVAATAGLGFRIQAIPEYLSIDLGVSGKFIYKMFLQAQSASTITDMLADDNADPADTYLNGTPIVAGYAFPVDFGVNLNMPLGFTASAVLKNYNGAYSMSTYQSINNWSEEVLGSAIAGETADSSSFTSEDFTIDAGWQLNAGLTWAPKIGSLLKPIFAFDVVDITSLADLSGDELKTGIYENARLGASLRILSIVDLRYGLRSGYQSFGVGLDLLIFHLDAAYYIQEYGAQLGDKPIDAVSLRFSLLSR
ncbi:hypothetical protein [uncultured Sphaerochaeta sp.]|uniref:hypothetical protein n=1 Tax=uncultured Sphaerochaeta sp. TaxID=886478 RepID=UPI002A0A64B0|nr:hypothetical protein [uncultured Sphaerochaeta sp.]